MVIVSGVSRRWEWKVTDRSPGRWLGVALVSGAVVVGHNVFVAMGPSEAVTVVVNPSLTD